MNEEIKKWRVKIAAAETILHNAKKTLRKLHDSKYPNGRFIIVRKVEWLGIGNTKTTHSMYSEQERNRVGVTDGRSYWGQVEGCPGVYLAKHRNSYGKQTVYVSLEKMLVGAKRLNIPDNVVAAFVKLYHEKMLGGNKFPDAQSPWDHAVFVRDDVEKMGEI